MTAQPSNSRHKDNPNQSLSKGLAVLEQLEGAEREIGVRELARQLGLSSTAVQRLVDTLKSHGFIEQNPNNKRYSIGHRAFQVGQSFIGRQAIMNIAFESLYDMAHREKVCAYLGVMRGNAMVYLLSLLNGPVSVNTPPGSCAYLHSTAIGKAIMGGMEPDQLKGYVAQLELPKLTPTTITDPALLVEEIRSAVPNGIFVCNNENIQDIYAVGAPIHDYTGQVVAAISFAMPHLKLQRTRGAQHLERLRGMAQDAAENISRKLGANISSAKLAPAVPPSAIAH